MNPVRIVLSGAPDRVREVAALLSALRERPGPAAVDAPGWLLEAFAPERTVAEAEDWLRRWRAAPDPQAFERAGGWTRSGWLHWFSAGNEFWRLTEVRVEDGGRCVVLLLDSHDAPVPVEALHWLGAAGGLRVSSGGSGGS